VTAVDGAGNRATRTGLGYVVDNTPPEGVDVQTANAPGGTPGRAEIGDRLVLTFSEPVEPFSVLDGWDGSPAPVVVRLRNALVGNHDGITVHDASGTTQASLGELSLGLTNYVTADRAFGATGRRPRSR